MVVSSERKTIDQTENQNMVCDINMLLSRALDWHPGEHPREEGAPGDRQEGQEGPHLQGIGRGIAMDRESIGTVPVPT